MFSRDALSGCIVETSLAKIEILNMSSKPRPMTLPRTKPQNFGFKTCLAFREL